MPRSVITDSVATEKKNPTISKYIHAKTFLYVRIHIHVYAPKKQMEKPEKVAERQRQQEGKKKKKKTSPKGVANILAGSDLSV